MDLTTLQNGRYEIKEELGRGSFGVTYLAYDTIRGHEVAIKEFFPSHVARRRTQTSELVASEKKENDFEAYKKKFLYEIKALIKFNHKNIVRVYEVFAENNTMYYTMEHLNGVNLWDYIESKGSLDEKEILKIIAPILDALETIHNTDEMLHRDLKPDNIMLVDDGDRAMIIDFGLVKYGFNESKSSSFTGLGNPHFSPYEQYCASCRKGAFTDIYTLCCTIYMMATGEPPIETNARTDGQKLPPISSNYSDGFKKTVYKGMELKSVDRWQSIKELRDELFKEEIALEKQRLEEERLKQEKIREEKLKQEAIEKDHQSFKTAQKLNNELSYSDYIENYPYGLHKAGALSPIDEFVKIKQESTKFVLSFEWIRDIFEISITAFAFSLVSVFIFIIGLMIVNSLGFIDIPKEGNFIGFIGVSTIRLIITGVVLGLIFSFIFTIIMNKDTIAEFIGLFLYISIYSSIIGAIGGLTTGLIGGGIGIICGWSIFGVISSALIEYYDLDDYALIAIIGTTIGTTIVGCILAYAIFGTTINI